MDAVFTTSFHEIEREYVKSNGATCPVCGNGNNLHGGDTVTVGSNGKVFVSNFCGDCGSTWAEVYKLHHLYKVKLADGTEIS